MSWWCPIQIVPILQRGCLSRVRAELVLITTLIPISPPHPSHYQLPEIARWSSSEIQGQLQESRRDVGTTNYFAVCVAHLVPSCNSCSGIKLTAKSYGGLPGLETCNSPMPVEEKHLVAIPVAIFQSTGRNLKNGLMVEHSDQ